MSTNIDRYQSALGDVEAQVLDCFTGYQNGSKTMDEIVDGIRAVGNEIRADGDPHSLAALEEIMFRPFRAWKVILNGPFNGGNA